MNPDRLRELLARVADGSCGIDSALEELRDLPFRDLGDVRIDTHRELRTGFPEIVFGQGKTPAQIATACRGLLDAGQPALVTRVDAEAAEALRPILPEFQYCPVSRTVRLSSAATSPVVASASAAEARGDVVLVTAGTSDEPVAAEAAAVLEFLGVPHRRVRDVGVAGMHRLAAARAELDSASVILVLAGMEGALASVVGGMVGVPVIAVPTSVGYGASFGGLAALLAMLSSCATGIVVVNIDNGVGAAIAAAQILRSR